MMREHVYATTQTASNFRADVRADIDRTFDDDDKVLWWVKNYNIACYWIPFKRIIVDLPVAMVGEWAQIRHEQGNSYRVTYHLLTALKEAGASELLEFNEGARTELGNVVAELLNHYNNALKKFPVDGMEEYLPEEIV